MERDMMERSAKPHAGSGGRTHKLFYQNTKKECKRLVNNNETKALKNLRMKCYKKQKIPTKTDQ